MAIPRLTAATPGPDVVESCWLCGIRVRAELLVPDGGSACASVRWYCRDMQACTERWTARRPLSTGIRQGSAEVARAL